MKNEIFEPIFLNYYLDPFFITLIMILGVLVNWKFLKNMTEDDSNRGANSNGLLIRDVMTTNAKTQMMVWPFLWVLFWLIQMDTTFPTWMQPWFCHLKFFAYIFRIYFAFNSLAVAAMRYTFIVHNTSISRFGIAQTKTVFYYGSILVPLLFAVFYECTINVPFERGGRAFEICKHSFPDTANKTFSPESGFESPIFEVFRDHMPKNVVYYLGITTKVFLAVIFGNLLEGFLYWKTFSFIARTQGSDFLDLALGKEQLQIRKRTNRINIKITFLSWALEFLSGIFVIIVRMLKYKLHWTYLIDVCLVFVIIPCTYVLNREVTKQIIVLGNWYQGIKSMFMSKSSQTNQILPLVENRRAQQRNQSLESSTVKNIPPMRSRIQTDRESSYGNDLSCFSNSRNKSPPMEGSISIDISRLHKTFRDRALIIS